MSTKNIFTGKTREEEKELHVRVLSEPIARILARAEALNPLPHLSGVSGFFSLGAGRRSGPRKVRGGNSSSSESGREPGQRRREAWRGLSVLPTSGQGVSELS